MSKRLLRLTIIPAVMNYQDSVFSFDPKIHGKTVSTVSEIKVNKVEDGYGILYFDMDFMSLNTATLLVNISNLMESNLPNTEFDFIICYLFMSGNTSMRTFIGDVSAVAKVLEIDRNLMKKPDTLKPLFYKRSNSVINLAKQITAAEKLAHGNAIASEESEDALKVREREAVSRMLGKPMDEDTSTQSFLDLIFGDEEKGKKKKKKKDKDDGYYYAASRILKASEDPKKQYKRHGVIVCNERSAIKRDIKTIEGFLEDFIPGKAGWEKDLRKELCKRFIGCYVVTKKQLKDLEKAHRKEMQKSIQVKKSKQVVNFAQNLLYTPIDHWNDPNR